MKKFLSGLIVLLCGTALMHCGGHKPDIPQTTFTKADSLTDCYLAYQDTMLQFWNIMINDDNQKIKSMHDLLHELLIKSDYNHELLRSYEGQLDQLAGLRYTQKSMGDADVVEEYDFASAALVTELISIAESSSEFAHSPTLQTLVEDIRMADQRVNNYREEYDVHALNYNSFLERNKFYLQEIAQSDSLEKKYLFQMVSAD